MKRANRLLAMLCLALALSLALPVVLPAGTGVIVAAQAREKVALNKTKATIYNGQKLKLKLTGATGKVSWSSSAKSVATVNSRGEVTAKKAGSAKITAKVNGNRYVCRLTVQPALTLKKTRLSLNVGDSGKVAVTYPLKGSIKCTSSDSKVVTGKVKAKSKGYELVITGKKAGKATLTLSNTVTKDKARLTVTVNEVKAERIELYGFLGGQLDEINGALTDKLTGTGIEYTNAGMRVRYCGDDEGDPRVIRSIDLYVNQAADAYSLCGVYNGMTREEADAALRSFGFEFDTDWGVEDGVEYWGDDKAGKGCVFSYWYDGDIVKDLYLRY